MGKQDEHSTKQTFYINGPFGRHLSRSNMLPRMQTDILCFNMQPEYYEEKYADTR